MCCNKSIVRRRYARRHKMGHISYGFNGSTRNLSGVRTAWRPYLNSKPVATEGLTPASAKQNDNLL